MCGIVGFNWEDKALVRKMADKISHRGPDDSGYYTDKNISLGHRRLSIIDLSERGHQPMLNENNKIAVVFNGEIYNYKILKENLEKKGHKFQSSSDTEVIIHGYEEYGEKICSLLEGMFAFAIWDVRSKKLLLARDRIGKKPLYYYFKNGKLIFGSEIKSMLLYDEISRKIDSQCLSDYLELRYSPGNRTMFEEIRKIEPGTYLTLCNSKIEVRRHWDLPKLTDKNKPSEEKVDAFIESAVKKRLMSDVPIGVFLSGGLDSSTIVAYMSRFANKINTFSVGFGDNTDETRYARLIAERFSTNHQEIRLDSDILSALPKIVWHFDEPLADPASLPTYFLCGEVSKKVKVALSGEGGDETFGGYDTFNYINKLRMVGNMPKILSRHVAGKSVSAISNLFEYPNKQILKLGSEILKNPSNLEENQKKLFYLPFDKEDKSLLLQDNVKKGINLSAPIEGYLRKTNNPWNNTIEYYFKEWLPNDLLMKVDKMSMAHGLEVRTPFLDSDLIDYFFGLDNKQKINRHLFRKVVSKVLPGEIMRRKKQGFTLPLSNWFLKKEFSDRMMPQLDDLSRRKLFKDEPYRKIVNNPKAFRNDHRMWVLLNLELWNKIYIDNKDYKKIEI